MGRAEETELKIAEILSFMAPSTLYNVTTLVRRSGQTYRIVQHRLGLAVVRGMVERVSLGKASLYRLLCSCEALRKPVATRAYGELKGWEAQWRQFRALCEVTRR